MAKQDKGKDSLFLLEALVDRIIFAKPFLSEKDFKTCVVIESPNLEPLEICDEDCGVETYKKGGSVVTNFNCGKSCLFSMKDSDINSAMSKFNIKATVYKCLPCGCLPEKILIGEAIIDMTKEFIQARNQFLQDPTNVSYQALKDSFRIHGADGVENGDILMFLRLSCFGKLIVTRFQGAGSSKFDVGTKSPNATSTANFPCNAGSGPTAICPQARDIYSNRPCIDSEDPCFCNGPKPSPHQPIACRNTDQYCLHIPKGRGKQFEEIGTTLCGNELKIKVPAAASVIKKISQTHLSMLSPFKNKSKQESLYPCEVPCAKNQISLSFPSEKTCCRGAAPAETQFTCTSEGCTQVAKHGQQAALNRGDLKLPTPNLDVFVLKVAKTAFEGDRKCRLEMELVTPKGGNKRVPTQKANSCLQSDLDCECYVRRLKKLRNPCKVSGCK